MIARECLNLIANLINCVRLNGFLGGKTKYDSLFETIFVLKNMPVLLDNNYLIHFNLQWQL